MSRINKLRRLREKTESEFVFPHNTLRKPFRETFHSKNSFIGGYLDRKLVDLASLYCVYTNQSKTDLMKGLYEEKAKEFPSEKEMMENICKTQLNRWIEFLESQEIEDDIQYDYRKKRLWKEYKKELLKEIQRVIPKYYTNFVISYIEDAQF